MARETCGLGADVTRKRRVGPSTLCNWLSGRKALREAAAVELRGDLEAPDPEQGIAMQVRLPAPLTRDVRLKVKGMRNQAQEAIDMAEPRQSLARASSLCLGACHVAPCLAFLPSEPS